MAEFYFKVMILSNTIIFKPTAGIVIFLAPKAEGQFAYDANQIANYTDQLHYISIPNFCDFQQVYQLSFLPCSYFISFFPGQRS